MDWRGTRDDFDKLLEYVNHRYSSIEFTHEVGGKVLKFFNLTQIEFQSWKWCQKFVSNLCYLCFDVSESVLPSFSHYFNKFGKGGAETFF